MKAIQVHQFMDLPSSLQEDGKVDALLSINGDVPKPTSLKKNQMLVRVLACSLSPGDVIMVQGNMIFMHQPFPFIPGMDICGEVVDSNGSANFKNDDVVVASNGLSPVGGMAEFMAIDMGEAAILPHGVSREQGASSSSAVTARNAVMDYVKAGDRVLILGGSGGVGSAAIQIAKTHAKASFIAVTSTQLDLCEELGADRVINYNDVDWWTVEEYQRKKFDVVIDTVGGGNFYGRAEKVLKTGKEGGTFVAVTGDDPQPDCSTAWKVMKFFGYMLTNVIYTKLKTRTLPNYVPLYPYDLAKSRKEVLEWMGQGTLTIKLDGDPLPFTVAGAREAFIKVGSHHAHGKVVVKIAE
jgi:NADPH:quinone reductase-like Zn-dependent oxidoreductase